MDTYLEEELYDILTHNIQNAGSYDLLIMDINMPQMSGFNLYEKIRYVF